MAGRICTLALRVGIRVCLETDAALVVFCGERQVIHTILQSDVKDSLPDALERWNVNIEHILHVMLLLCRIS